MAAPTICCSLGTAATNERIRKSQAFVEAAERVTMFGVLRLLPKDTASNFEPPEAVLDEFLVSDGFENSMVKSHKPLVCFAVLVDGRRLRGAEA
ncbi:hypothetical protein HK405_013692, partial [Cladochytrium tenue]